MKKRTILSFIVSCLVSGITIAQDEMLPDSIAIQRDTVKEKYNCFITIKTISGEKLEAALSRLTADSVYLSPLDENYVKAGGRRIKILEEEKDTAIGVDQIYKFMIQYDPDIIYRDELNNKKKQLKKQHAGKIIRTTLVVAGTVAMIPLSEGVIDPTIPLQIANNNSAPTSYNASSSGYNLRVSKHKRAFTLKGKMEAYVKMVKVLTKTKTNPFENNPAADKTIASDQY